METDKMNLTLVRIGIDEAVNLWKMQIEAFQELYEKYQDTETSPATESLEQTVDRLKRPTTYCYYIQKDNIPVGAVRVVDTKEEDAEKRLSQIFVMPRYQNRGIAQNAIRLVEEIHGSSKWVLDTVLQEAKNCHLYEKMGYHQTGLQEKINDKLTLVLYVKD